MLSLILSALVLVGFSKTFYFRSITGVPDVLGSPALPIHLIAHGLFLSAWYTTLIAQTLLVANNPNLGSE